MRTKGKSIACVPLVRVLFDNCPLSHEKKGIMTGQRYNLYVCQNNVRQ